MSAPIVTGEPWVWGEMRSNIETGYDDETNAMQYRKHVVFRRSKKFYSSEVNALANFELGNTSTSVTANIGGTAVTKSLTVGKFVCVDDDLPKIEHPSEWIERTQTWEHFSAWTAIPATWDWETEP